MTILVTGCLGFIGSNLVPRLLSDGHSVVGFDNMSNCSPNATHRMKALCGPINWGNFKFYNADVREFNAMHSICTHHAIDAIVHLAAIGSVPRSFNDPAAYVDNNEKGFVNVAKLASHLAIKRLVYASSSSVYGSQPVKDERFVPEPLSPYAISKFANELFANVWSRATGVRMTGLRFFNVYGPGQHHGGAYSAVIPEFITNPHPTVNGSDAIERDFTYVEDVCDAIILAISSADSRGVYNVGTGVTTSLAQILGMIGKQAKLGPRRPGDVMSSHAVTSLSEHQLGFKARTKFADGLIKTVEYFERLAHGGKPETSTQISEGT